MRITEHDLNSLRSIVRKLQEENRSLRQLLDSHDIPYEDNYVLDDTKTNDEYDEDQGSRILPLNPNVEMAITLYMLIDEMKKAGIRVRQLVDLCEHYAVIDNEVVWHGGVNILGKADVYDDLIRVVNKQAAAELLDIAAGLLVDQEV